MSSPGARVLTWRKCSQLAYMSTTGICFHNQHKYPQIPGEYVVVSNRRACLSMSPPPAHKKSCAYHLGFKSIKSLDSDRGMDRCHYAGPFIGISIRSKKLFFHLNKPNNYKKTKMKGGTKLDNKLLLGMNSVAF